MVVIRAQFSHLIRQRNRW
uniref:Uncharacterized protein n=1 Tax=Anguilla anguilla TaxID=7936 RepID=A0A0E9Y0C4_ANGAN